LHQLRQRKVAAAIQSGRSLNFKFNLKLKICTFCRKCYPKFGMQRNTDGCLKGLLNKSIIYVCSMSSNLSSKNTWRRRSSGRWSSSKTTNPASNW